MARETEERRKHRLLHNTLNIGNQTGALYERQAEDSRSFASKFFQYMAEHGSITKAPSEYVLIQIDNYHDLPQNMQPLRNDARAFAKGTRVKGVSANTSFTVGLESNFSSPRHRSPDDPANHKITCEIAEFMGLCKSLGIEKFNPKIQQEWDILRDNPDYPPGKKNDRTRPQQGR